jgi:response regulator of citrate/malate metabolism
MESNDPIMLLFVGDDTRYMALIPHLLATHEAQKFSVHWHQHAGAALELLKSGQIFDLLLVDSYLPEPNGVELLRETWNADIDVPVYELSHVVLS